MSKVQVQTEIDTQALLAGAAKLKVKELEEFIRDLHGLVTRKKTEDKTHNEKVLLSQINQTVLEKKKRERYFELAQKLSEETINPIERQEFLTLTSEEENLRNTRVKLMIELAQLRNIPLTQLMEEIGLTPPGYGDHT